MNKKLIAGVVAAATAGGAYFLTPSKEYDAHMYVMRGLLGGNGFEFSKGVDVVAVKVEKAYKVKTTVTSWTQAQSLCDAARENYKKDKKPIILLGHSLGANNVSKIAHCLKGIPVAFALYYDPTPFVGCVPANVKYATSWRRSFPLDLGGGTVKRCDGSTKNTANITVRTRHTVLDDLPSIHDATIKRVGIAIKEAQGGKG